MKEKLPVTPMMQQYLKIKEEYADCILFFRLGDFYEMFFDDAITASEVLEITLTGKDCGMEERAPMCGVPYHSVQGYIAKLIKSGYKVAICEQTEDPKNAKGIVKRDVIRVITPGTANLDSVLEGGENNFLACICLEQNHYGLSFADVSTGEIITTEGDYDLAENSLINAIAAFRPKEVIMNQSSSFVSKKFVELKKRYNFFDGLLEDKYFDERFASEQVTRHFKGKTPDSLGLDGRPFCIRSLGAMLAYLYETQKIDLTHMSTVRFFENSQYLKIDLNSARNLEITECMRTHEKKGSLLSVLDKTKTAMGSRRLRNWLERPLVNENQINDRLDSVEELFKDMEMREELTEALKKIYDIERLLSKVVYGSCNARDFLSLKQSLDKLPLVKKALDGCESPLLSSLCANIDTCSDIRLLIDCAIVEDPPITVKEGGMIKKGFDKELDSIRDIHDNGTSYVAAIETQQREKTGIKNLKISFNKVFGYYIEISKSQLDKVPEEYIRKQTLVNAERFITQELKDLENRILSSKDRINSIEYEDFSQIKNKIYENLARLQECARNISVIDAILSLANTAAANGYCKPTVDSGDVIDIKDGRHPIVENMLDDSLFVPNDTYLDTRSNRFSIITGPNMAGKSTYMRQTALIALMAQMGSFVPARRCRVGITDAVFTRVGASDDLSSGQSTFMVEMNEVAHILKNATAKSLIILDEIGRGTSTFDGLSIAWAVSEYICSKQHIGAKTLFATHYHELTDLESKIDGIKNYYVAVKKRGDDITFLRKIVKGAADDSFGIEVALLAGVPHEVTDRAKEVLAYIESDSSIQLPDTENIMPHTETEPKISSEKESEIIETLKNIDTSTLTPIEALNELYKLQQKVSEL